MMLNNFLCFIAGVLIIIIFILGVDFLNWIKREPIEFFAVLLVFSLCFLLGKLAFFIGGLCFG